jgi:hypothetical protein
MIFARNVEVLYLYSSAERGSCLCPNYMKKVVPFGRHFDIFQPVRAEFMQLQHRISKMSEMSAV